jgi:hypothetical protein
MDYRLSDLDWHKEDFLGSGVFADVFKGRLKMSNRTEDVALKYCKDPLSEKVVSKSLWQKHIPNALITLSII